MSTPDPASQQPQKIILIPPNHEQSWPSFHVEEALLEPLLAHLKANGIEPMQEPEPLGNLGPKGNSLFEVEVSDDCKVEQLEEVLSSFIQKQGISA